MPDLHIGMNRLPPSCRETPGTAYQPDGRFRSKGETQIGRCLERHGIDYFYEYPLAVVDRGMTRIWYPDFQLRPKALVIEYGGRLDDPCYAQGWRRKHQVYDANGIDALMLTPRDLDGDWPDRLLDRIEQVLSNRLSRFRERRTEPDLTPARSRSPGTDGLGGVK